MDFQLTSKVRVKKDTKGAVRQLVHPLQVYTKQTASEGLESVPGGMSRRQLADSYLRAVTPLYQFDEEMVSDLNGDMTESLRAEGPKLRFDKEKVVRGKATVTYKQTVLGLPVWESGLTVRMRAEPAEVTGSQSSVHESISARNPSPDARYMPQRIEVPVLAELLALRDDDSRPTINGRRMIVYRYDAENRGACALEPREGSDTEQGAPVLSPPPVPDSIVSGQHYVVVEVLFTWTSRDWGELNWSAFIEPETGAVLFLRAFVSCVDGFVLERDPLTSTGDTSIRPSSQPGVLDSVRNRVLLQGLTPPPDNEAQHLVGEFVRILNISPPNVAPPTGSFFFSVPTNDFSAVNAYYHCDRLFRMMREMGFDVFSYFDGTTFPVRVDHRATIGGSSNTVNAQAPGNFSGNGSDGFRFALLQVGTQVGIAVDWRVVLHEFGHTILWDNVSSPNFRFAHSAGDSLAAILNDVETQAPDPGRTFPWTIITRRHDRTPAGGWGWGGIHDDIFPVGHPSSSDRAGYDREQILSATLFRLYRSLGGAHADLEARRFASRYTTLMVFSSVGSMTSVAQPQDAEDLADLLIEADQTLDVFEGQSGAFAHKVIRWAFEQQGAYQPAGAPIPVTSAGLPPAVDVFIDDGRGGGYSPDTRFVADSTELWLRAQDDGDTEHQDPVPNQESSVYVRVGNRGSSPAQNTRVRLFQSSNTIDPTWPADWTEIGSIATASISAGGELVLGPIPWTPTSLGEVALLAAAETDEDGSNLNLVANPIQTSRLVHCDNNLALRRVTVVSDGGGGTPNVIKVQASPGLTIPDADPQGVQSTLEVTQAGTLANIAVALEIRHTFIGDLTVELVSPSGSRTRLHNRTGFDTQDLIRSYASETNTALAALRGENTKGTWRLELVDHAGRDVGTLEKWELTIELDTQSPLVERQSNPNRAIPDNDPDGISDTITVDPTGNLDTVAVNVDIRHDYIGDLRVSLRSPQGTEVFLHNMTGTSTHDLVKTYTRDTTPGLSQLQNEPLEGPWQLLVSDRLGADEGTLVSWGLELKRS